jgi:uncharacterized membrane protein YbhN (UPF0104 family)
MTRSARRTVAPLLGVALLAAAAWSVARNHDAACAAWAAIRAPSPTWLATLPLAVMATVALTGLSLLWLTNRAARESRLSFAEMVALTLASTLGNMVPMQPGLAGRVAYQHQVHGIPVAVSVLVAVQSTLLTVVAVAWLGLALLLVRSGGLSWVAAPASLLLLAPALLDPARRGSVLPRAFSARFIEVLLSALRTSAAFALIGRPIDPLAALVLACASNAANCLPLVGNGLGVREWITGLLAPGVAGVATPDALAAELLNRAVELLIVVPGGLLSTGPLARRLGDAMRTRRVEPAEGMRTGEAAAVRWSMTLGSAQPPPSGDPPPPRTPTSSES